MTMITKSYKQTKVNWGKSQANIAKLLSKFGISDTRFTFLTSKHKLICEFNYPTKIGERATNIGIRIIVPIPELANEEQAKNQVHRALFYYIKSKFEALEFNLVEFIQEFMPHIVVFDKCGQLKTVYELFEPQYRNNILTGKKSEIMLIGDGN